VGPSGPQGPEGPQGPAGPGAIEYELDVLDGFGVNNFDVLDEAGVNVRCFGTKGVVIGDDFFRPISAGGYILEDDTIEPVNVVDGVLDMTPADPSSTTPVYFTGMIVSPAGNTYQVNGQYTQDADSCTFWAAIVPLEPFSP
jgi:hypothetical protein